MRNLIGMTDFILEQRKTYNGYFEDLADLYYRYAKFLKQPLELWMFVPCVDNEIFNYSMHGNKEQFEQAKERCLFKGFLDTTGSPQYSHYISDGMQAVFYVTKNGSSYNNILGMKTIEDLTNKTTIILTQTAIKQIGL